MVRDWLRLYSITIAFLETVQGVLEHILERVCSYHLELSSILSTCKAQRHSRSSQADLEVDPLSGNDINSSGSKLGIPGTEIVRKR